MEVTRMRIRVKPYKGKHVSRKYASRFNHMILSASAPDRSEMYKEAKEFEKILKVRRAKSGL